MMYDVAIIGLGAMGSAAAFHLAERGRRVIGFDRHAPPHAYGSSHGDTRIIRQAYFEHPQYVPLVQRAYAGWDALEARTGERLFTRTGGLMIGTPESAVVRGALASAAMHGLAYELLDAEATRARFPAFALPAHHVAVLEPDAGFLVPEACVRAHLTLAAAAGATLHTDEPCTSIETRDDAVEITTSRASYVARHAVIAAGAWTGELVPRLASVLRVERMVQHWFAPAHHLELFTPSRFPIFIWELDDDAANRATWYGFPMRERGLKLAIHHQGDTVSANHVIRDVSALDVARVTAIIARYMPAAVGTLRDSEVCLYTNTPDEDFVIDGIPDTDRITIVSACSGHGFKFSSAIGEAVAQRIVDGACEADLSPFALARFLARPATATATT